jgi:hypothetical protein
LYASLDSTYFAARKLFGFALEFHQMGGETLFLDEVHKYPDWSIHVKSMVDEGENFKVYTSSAPTDALGNAAIPVYRAWMDDKDFNPANGVVGGHFFTADRAAYDAMVKLVGVTGEGVAFYGEVPGP